MNDAYTFIDVRGVRRFRMSALAVFMPQLSNTQVQAQGNIMRLAPPSAGATNPRADKWAVKAWHDGLSVLFSYDGSACMAAVDPALEQALAGTVWAVLVSPTQPFPPAPSVGNEDLWMAPVGPGDDGGPLWPFVLFRAKSATG